MFLEIARNFQISFQDPASPIMNGIGIIKVRFAFIQWKFISIQYWESIFVLYYDDVQAKNFL